MVAFSFNPQQYNPSYGGSSQLPPGDYIGVIASTKNQDVVRNGAVTGGYLALSLTPIEGAQKGMVQIDRLNLFNSDATTVKRANERLSAYCVVTNTQAIQADTDELCNKPFKFTVGWQKGQEPSETNPNGGFTEVKAIYGADGRAPEDIIKGGAAPAAAPAAPPPAAPPPAGYAVDQGAPPAPAPAPAPAAPAAPAAPGGWPAGGAAAPAAPTPAGGAPGGWPGAAGGGAPAPAGWGNR